MFTNRYPLLPAPAAHEVPEMPQECPCCGASLFRLSDDDCEATYYLCGGYYWPQPFQRSPEGLPLWGGVCGRPDLAALAALKFPAETAASYHAMQSV